MRTRTVVIAGLVLCLLLAGVVSGFASASPDGLEYVAEQTGFIDAAEDSAVADSPLADYGVRGLDGPLSGGLAGVIGVALTAALMFGLVRLLGRRRDAGHDSRD